MTETILRFFDEDGVDITDLVELTDRKATPWYESATLTYMNALLGPVVIGAISSAGVIVRSGYTYTKSDK